LSSVNSGVFLTPEFANRYTIGICCDTGRPKYDSLINVFKNNTNASFVFEKRGTYSITDIPIESLQLDNSNYINVFSQSNFIYQNSTIEPVKV